MRISRNNLARLCRTLSVCSLVCGLVCAQCGAPLAQQDKGAPAKPSLTGRYEGTAKNKAEEVITITIELTEKEGALSGMIKSSHGDFPITGGSHQGETITIQFDADSPGTISLRMTEGKLVGTWNAGDDGGPVEVKKAATADGGAKGKS
jgi:hypothetical protein